MRRKKVLLLSLFLLTLSTIFQFNFYGTISLAETILIENTSTQEIQAVNTLDSKDKTGKDSFFLADEDGDNTTKPVSVNSDSITEYQLLSDGTTQITYDINGEFKTGLYLEPDLYRSFDEGEFSYFYTTLSVPYVAEELGFSQLSNKVAQSNTDIIVAVLDTGVDVYNLSLKSRLLPSYNAVNNRKDYDDTNGHGTHVAGIIAMSTPSNVKILPIDVFDESGLAKDSDIVTGIYYAVNQGAKVINMSLSGEGKTNYLENAIQYAIDRDVIVVVSSGNDATDNGYLYPAAFDDVVTVGATNTIGGLLSYSNFGDSVDICAPGENIVSTYLDNTTISMSGTSMASPFISAASALIWLDQPDLDADEVKKIMLSQTKDLGALGKDQFFGYGEINLTGYASSESFYLIGHTYANVDNIPEYKFDLPIKFYSDNTIETIDFLVDGVPVKTLYSTDSVQDASLNIRKLKLGEHMLTVTINNTNGSQETVINSKFLIPDYNVSIIAFDLLGNIVGSDNFRPQMEFYEYDIDENIYDEPSSLFMDENVYQLNIDFTAMAKAHRITYGCLNLSYSDTPFYFRGLFASGLTLLEPLSCETVTFESDWEFGDNAYVEYNIPLDRFKNSKYISPLYERVLQYTVGMRQLLITQEVYDNPGGTYSISQDKGNFFVKIYNDTSYSDSIKPPEVLYNDYLCYLDDFDLTYEDFSDVSFKLAPEAYFNQIEIVDPVSLSYVVNVDLSYLDGVADSYDVKLGRNIYNVTYCFKHALNNRELFYKIFTNINLFEPLIIDSPFLEEVKEKVMLDSGDGVILHELVNNVGGSIVITEHDYVNPILVLTDTKTKATYRIKGYKTILGYYSYVNEQSQDAYKLRGIPNGKYRMTFEYEEGVIFFPYTQYDTVVEIKDNKIFNGTNTAPSSDTSHTYYITKNFSGWIDLNRIFKDNEQSTLVYKADKGCVIGNILYFSNYKNNDIVVKVNAYDGAGGVTTTTLNLIRSHDNENGDDFTPIPEIISMDASNWAKGSIAIAITENLVENSILSQYQEDITRGEVSIQAVKILEKYVGTLKTADTSTFKDTESEAILKAFKAGILSGTDKEHFSPQNTITREQFCVVIYKLAQNIENRTYDTKAIKTSYKDQSSISSWAIDAVKFCSNNAIIAGNNGKLSPKSNVTREEAIVMFVKLYEQITNKTLK
ncbi:MAG: hypothetical protein BGO41_10325 [Clostridiales bacterium 38-18]|nr:MAG: hypothetical protein BGO41_10325 [Clostridiales bacterium 38-18]